MEEKSGKSAVDMIAEKEGDGRNFGSPPAHTHDPNPRGGGGGGVGGLVGEDKDDDDDYHVIQEAVKEVNDILSGTRQVVTEEVTAGSQFRKGANKLQLLFIRVLRAAHKMGDKNLLAAAKDWCRQQHPDFLGQTWANGERVDMLPYEENEELPDWMDHVTMEERKPAPPFETWMLVVIKQCREWYVNQPLPAKAKVAKAVGNKYYMQASGFLSDGTYKSLKDSLSKPPSDEELALCLPSDATPEVSLKTVASARPSETLNTSARPSETSNATSTATVIPATPAPGGFNNDNHPNPDPKNQCSPLSPVPEGFTGSEADYRQLQATELKKKLKKTETDLQEVKTEKKQLFQLNCEQSVVNVNQSTVNVNVSEAGRHNAESTRVLTTTNSGLVTDNKNLNEDKVKLLYENANLQLQLVDLKCKLSERNKEIVTLLNARGQEDDEFFKSVDAIAPKRLFYAIAKVPANLAVAEQELEDDDYQHPTTLTCNLSLLKTANLPKFLELLMPAVCCYDSSLKVVLLLTATDDREHVTDDSIDGAFYTLLPKIGFLKDHNLSFKHNGKDYSLAVASQTIAATNGTIGLLARVISLHKKSERLSIEGSESEQAAKVPISQIDFEFIFKAGCCGIRELEIGKCIMTVEQQPAVKTSHGKMPVKLSFDRVVFEKNGNTFPLLERDIENGLPLILYFKHEVNIGFTELTKAIQSGRVGEIGFEGVKLTEGQEEELKELLRTAQDASIQVSLSWMTHQTRSEQDMLNYFTEFHVNPNAFSEAPPEVGEDDNNDKNYSPNSKFKVPDYDLWGQLPCDEGKCGVCSAATKKGTECSCCGAFLPKEDGTTIPTTTTTMTSAETNKEPNVLRPGAGISNSVFSFPVTSKGGVAPGAAEDGVTPDGDISLAVTSSGSGSTAATSSGPLPSGGVINEGGFSFFGTSKSGTVPPKAGATSDGDISLAVTSSGSGSTAATSSRPLPPGGVITKGGFSFFATSKSGTVPPKAAATATKDIGGELKQEAGDSAMKAPVTKEIETTKSRTSKPKPPPAPVPPAPVPPAPVQHFESESNQRRHTRNSSSPQVEASQGRVLTRSQSAQLGRVHDESTHRPQTRSQSSRQVIGGSGEEEGHQNNQMRRMTRNRRNG